MTCSSDENQKTKLTLQIDGCTVTWEKEANDCNFEEILNGFLACMWGQTFVPGTEMHVFRNYLDEMEGIYPFEDSTQDDIIESRKLEAKNCVL